MIFERHGRGKIFGNHPNVCEVTLFDKASFAEDDADVWRSSFIASRASGTARIRLSELHHSAIGEKGQWSEIVGAVVKHSTIRRGRVLGSTLFGVEMDGGIIRNSFVTNCRIRTPNDENADVGTLRYIR